MSFGFNSHSISKRGKQKTKQIGNRSIYDIINREASVSWKINYIRHHYTYYEGNYDLFHDERGKATDYKRHLDKIIEKVVYGKANPNVLNDINKEILALRKQKDKELEEKERLELDKAYELSQKVLETGKQSEIISKLDIPKYKQVDDSAQVYLNMIERYLSTLTPDARKDAETWSYRDLKKVAKFWERTNGQATPKEMLEKSDNSAFIASYNKYFERQEKNKSN